jgi:hypothetical protein
MQALDDVNEDDLNAALMSSNGSVKPLSDKRIRATFYLTEDAKYRLKDFLANDLGIDTNKGKKKLIQMVGEAQNRQVLAKIRNVPTQDGTGVYPKLEKTAPVTEE